MLAVIASLCVTVGLLLMSLALLRKFGNSGLRRNGALGLKVIQKISVGPKQGVALVQVGRRVLVVAIGERDTTLLTELEGDDLRTTLGGDSGEVTIPSFRQSLNKIRKLGTIGMVLLAGLLAQPLSVEAQATPQNPQSVTTLLPQFDMSIGGGGDESGLQITGPVGLVLFLGVMTVIPALLLMMTSFTRILIVLHMVRSALGTQSSPPNQLLIAMALVMTMVTMGPTFDEANRTALQPYLRGEISQENAFKFALEPFRRFMLANTGDNELQLFVELSGTGGATTMEQLPTMTLMSSFVTSELRTAFQMGFVIFLPFIVIDLVVASVLMSMGMFMLPPVMVSLPFKLLLFVLADGWVLLVRGTIASFNV